MSRAFGSQMAGTLDDSIGFVGETYFRLICCVHNHGMENTVLFLNDATPSLLLDTMEM